MESISFGVWQRCDNFRYLPQIPACYLIYLGNKLLYVGQSVNVRKRFNLHQLSYNYICHMEFTGDPREIVILYRRTPKDELESFELELIAKLRPLLNRAHNRGVR